MASLTRGSSSGARRRGAGTFTASALSLKSARSVAEKLPKARVCPWAAQWFTVPQLGIKLSEMVLGITSFILLIVWRSHEVTIQDFNKDPYNFRNRIYCFMGLGVLSTIYAATLVVLGTVGFKLPPTMQTLLAIGLMTCWMFSSAVMSTTIDEIDHSYFARSMGLDTSFLTIATGLGFVSLVVLVMDVLLGMLAVTTLDDSKDLAREIEQSKSILMSVRSGRSLQHAHKAASPSAVRQKKSESDISEHDQPTTKTSPLKEHEERQSDFDSDGMESSVV